MDYLSNEYDDEADLEQQRGSQLDVVNPREVYIDEFWPDATVLDWRSNQKLDFHKASLMIVDELLESSINDMLLYELLPEMLETN